MKLYVLQHYVSHTELYEQSEDIAGEVLGVFTSRKRAKTKRDKDMAELKSLHEDNTYYKLIPSGDNILSLETDDGEPDTIYEWRITAHEMNK